MAARSRARLGVEPEGISLTEELREGMAVDRAKRSDERVSFWTWARRIPEPKTGTLDFDLFPFQRELYESDEFTYARDGGVKKATQAGVSAWLLRWAMFWPDTRGDTGLYVFPKARHLKDFSDQRVAPMIRRSDYLRRRISRDSVDNKLLKQIGLGFLNFRGSHNEDEVNSVDADVLGFDEYDSLILRHVTAAERRVSAPTSKGLIRRVGVPTVPGFGIARWYENRSDMRVWMVKCACRTEMPIGFYPQRAVYGMDEPCAYVDQERAAIVCWKCQRPLSPAQVAKGRWVALRPDREARGYHIPRLIVPGVDVAAMIENSKKREAWEVTNFWNKDLGLEYASEEDKLTLAILQAAQSAGGEFFRQTGYSGQRPVTAGLDVASVRNLNLRVSEQLDEYTKRALWVGEVASFDDVAAMMERYRISLLVVDHLPEGRLARSLANRFPGRVYICSYQYRPAGDAISVNDEQFTVSVDRTRAIDAMMAMMRAQKNYLPQDLPEGYGAQMQAPTRFVEQDETGKIRVGYKSGSPDHYAHAEVYDLVATELLWRRVALTDALTDRSAPLDDLMEFQRSTLDNTEETEYRPGPEEILGGLVDDDDERWLQGDYSPGFDD